MKDNINQIAYYKSLVYDAKKKIKNAKEAEFNTDMYESVLNQIINKEYNEKDYKIHVDAYSNINYLDRITNLENLIKELDKIEVYIKTFNIACYVDMQLDKEHISSYNVNNLVNIMLESLGEIKNMDIYS